MNLCKYKNALGVPDKGIHSYRLFGVAIADVIMTVISSSVNFLFFKNFFYKNFDCIIFIGNSFT